MSFHLAGIVPVTTKPMDFCMDWHDCLMPLAPNFYAIERAVLECAYAGCETIWIIASDDTTPLVRHRLGDYIQDPISLGRKGRFPSLERRPIPIFYVPADKRHDNKSDCVSWTILHGAKTAYDVSANLSKWFAPSRFYVSFSHGIYQPQLLRPLRKEISKDINFAVKFLDRSYINDDMLGFTFNVAQLKESLEIFRETDSSLLWGEKLENEKEYYENNFSLDKVFGHVIIGIDKELEVPWFHQIDGWDSYCDFLSSEDRKGMKHPGPLIMSYREFNPVGEDNE